MSWIRGFMFCSDILFFVINSYKKSQVGLALVVDNEIVLGVMGCPNWRGDFSDGSTGTLMVSHIGCGTWSKRLQNVSSKVSGDWTRCFVDACGLVNKAQFCIPESETWESLPLPGLFDARIDSDDLKHKEILLLPTCCGRYPLTLSRLKHIIVLQNCPSRNRNDQYSILVCKLQHFLSDQFPYLCVQFVQVFDGSFW